MFNALIYITLYSTEQAWYLMYLEHLTPKSMQLLNDAILGFVSIIIIKDFKYYQQNLSSNKKELSNWYNNSMLNDFPKAKNYDGQRESLAFELTQQIINHRGPYSELQIKNFEHVLWFIQFGWRLPDKKFYRQERKNMKRKKTVVDLNRIGQVSGQNPPNDSIVQDNSKKAGKHQYSNPEYIHYTVLRKNCLKQIERGQIVLPKCVLQPSYDFSVGQKIKYNQRKQKKQKKQVKAWYIKQLFENCDERPKLKQTWRTMRKEIFSKWQEDTPKQFTVQKEKKSWRQGLQYATIFESFRQTIDSE